MPLLSLHLPSEETQSWQTVAEKGKRHTAPNNSTQTSSGTFFTHQKCIRLMSTHTCSHRILYAEWESRGSRRSSKTPSPIAPIAPIGRVHKQHSWPPQATPDDTRNKFRRSDQRSSPVCVLPEEKEESTILELLHKDEHNFPSLGTSPQTVKPVQTHLYLKHNKCFTSTLLLITEIQMHVFFKFRPLLVKS